MSLTVNRQNHEAGTVLRKAILGEARVQQALSAEDDLIEFHHLFGHECAYAQIWSRSALEPKLRSMVTVAMLAALTPRGESLKVHMRGALINGATRKQLRQVLATISFYLGAGIGTEVITSAREELGIEGDIDRSGDAAISNVSVEEMQRRGRALREKLFDVDAVPTSSHDEGDARYEAIKTEYYFGTLWVHPDLTLQERVMVVIGILCACGRRDQLAVYLRAAQRIGCSYVQIKELFLTSCIYCGAPACEDGLIEARQVFERELEANPA